VNFNRQSSVKTECCIASSFMNAICLYQSLVDKNTPDTNRCLNLLMYYIRTYFYDIRGIFKEESLDVNQAHIAYIDIK
jgi:hypothetical protein